MSHDDTGPRYVMRRARPADHSIVMGLLEARISWLTGKGTDQWTTRPFGPVMATAIAAGQTWLMHDQERVDVATLTMTTQTEPKLWSPVEAATPCLYLSKLATDPGHAGRGLGRRMIAWAIGYAAERGISLLRWDSWLTNPALTDYYQSIGFKPLRAMPESGRKSAVLFEVAYQSPPAVDVDTAAIRVPVAVLPSMIVRDRRPSWLGLADAEHARLGDSYGAQDGEPGHWHRVDSLDVPPLSTPLPVGTAAHPLLVAADAPVRRVLVHNGAGWTLRGHFPQQVASSWRPPRRLVPGLPYEIVHEQTAAGCRVVVLGDQAARGGSSTTGPPPLARVV